MNGSGDDGFALPVGRAIGPVVMEMKHITLRFGGVTATADISSGIREGEIRAVISPNGTSNALTQTSFPASLCRRRARSGTMAGGARR